MPHQIKYLGICIFVLFAMILLSVGVLAEEKKAALPSLPTVETKETETPSDSVVPSAQPIATPELQPSPSVLSDDESQNIVVQSNEVSEFTTVDVEGGVSITKYNGSATDLVIPAIINGKKVLSIADNSYPFRYNTQIQTIVISEGIVTIGGGAFSNATNLKQVTIPSTVTKIGGSVFSGTSISKITIPSTVTSVDSQFFGYGNVTAWVYGDEGSAAESAARASGCVFISNNTKQSGDYYYTVSGGKASLVAYVGSENTVNINTLDGITVNNIMCNAFNNNQTLQNLIVSASVEDIGRQAFYGCTGLKTVQLSEGLNNIGEYAFKNCSNLQSVTIPNSLTAIGKSAFSSCTALEKVAIGSGLVELKGEIFAGDTNLAYIEIPENVTTISDTALGTGYADWDVYKEFDTRCKKAVIYGKSGSPAESFASKQDFPFVDETVKKAGDLYYKIIDDGAEIVAYAGDSETLKLDQVDGIKITSIGNSAFEGQKKLKSIEMGASIQSIGSKAFMGCGLTSLTTNSELRTIGDKAFSGCTNLAKIVLNDGLQSIGADAFHQTGITNITIPNSVTEIATGLSSSFSFCPLLKEATIGAGVQNLGGFYDCENLEAVNISKMSKATSVAEDGFVNCWLTSIQLPTTVKTISHGAFKECENLKEFDIPEGVETIDNDAFAGCFYLSKVTIPASVKTIGYSIFDCDDKVAIFGKINSKAEEFAAQGNYPFISENTKKDGAYYYETVTGGVKLIKADNPDNTKVPATLGGLPVIEIGCRAYYEDDKIEEVNCETLKAIDSAAFSHCQNLKTVAMGNQLTILGESAFESCDSLESVKCGTGLSSIPTDVFANCNMLTSVNIPVNVSTIASNIFGYQPYQVVIYGAESSCAQTYANSNGIRFVVDGMANENGYFYESVADGVKIVATDHPNKDTIPETLGGKPVVEIGDYAFDNDAALTTIKSSQLKRIGKGAFYSCTGLKDVTLISGATSIGGDAFYGCSSLKKVSVPASVTELGANALGGPTTNHADDGFHRKNMEYFYIYGTKGSAAETYANENNMRFISDSTPEEYGYYYETVDEGVKIIASDNPQGSAVPDTLGGQKVVEIGENAFANELSLTDVVLGINVKAIDENAFMNCKNLKTCKMSDNTMMMGAGAFSFCEKLETVTLGKNIKTLETMSFEECNALNSIILPSNIKEIEFHAFCQCDNLKNVTFLDEVSDCTIHSGAFYCKNLTKVVISSGVSEIDKGAFYASGHYIGWTPTIAWIDVIPSDLTIYGSSDSAAQAFAEKYFINFCSTDYALGDINADKAINASDALQALRHSVGEIKLEGEAFTRGDVTKDKKINASDALQILRFSVKEINSFQ